MARLRLIMLTPTQRNALLALARRSIECGLTFDGLAPLESSDELRGLQRDGASFVTLRIGLELRGCIGSIEARRPLVEDVWTNAWSAASVDPRFPVLTREELTRVHIHVSVLSEPERMFAASEAELRAALQPGIDGLVLEHGASRATFLPSVWEQLPDPDRFVRQLKLKAGWPQDFWSPDIRAWRYRSESFEESEGSLP